MTSAPAIRHAPLLKARSSDLPVDGFLAHRRHVIVQSRMWVQRFPVTFLLGVQLLAMVVIPTLSNNTEPVGTIVGISALAIAGALYFELLMLPLMAVSFR